MTTPPEFEEEFQDFFILMSRPHDREAADGDVPRIRMVIRDFERLYARWKPRLEDPEGLAALEGARVQVRERLVKSLEIRWLVHLLELVMARAAAARAPRQLREIAGMLESIAKSPAEEREREERESGEKIDLEADYRESEAGVERAEEHSRALRQRFAELWPERLDRAVTDRLERLDDEDERAWRAEIDARLRGLGFPVEPPAPPEPRA